MTLARSNILILKLTRAVEVTKYLEELTNEDRSEMLKCMEGLLSTFSDISSQRFKETGLKKDS